MRLSWLHLLECEAINLIKGLGAPMRERTVFLQHFEGFVNWLYWSFVASDIELKISEGQMIVRP